MKFVIEPVEKSTKATLGTNAEGSLILFLDNDIDLGLQYDVVDQDRKIKVES